MGRENPLDILKKFGATLPLLDRNHPVDVSRLSRGNVPSVPQTSCPIYVELHINQVGTSRMFQDSHPNRPRHTSDAYRPPNSFMCCERVRPLQGSKSPKSGREVQSWVERAPEEAGRRAEQAKSNLDPRVGLRVAPQVGPRVDPRVRPRDRP